LSVGLEGNPIADDMIGPTNLLR